MPSRFLVVSSLMVLLGACATPSLPDVGPLESLTHPVTPETAQSLAERGYYAQAIAGYRAALQTNPEDAASRYGLAEALRKMGKSDEAKAEYAILLANAEWKARGLEGLGRISFAAGDRTGALGLFNQAVGEDPKAWSSWLGIAQLHDLDGNWAKADEAYAFALSASNRPAIVYNNHGVSKLARGDSVAAADLFRSALASDPGLERARINLDLAQAVTGKSITAVSASEHDARARARALNNYGYVAMLQDRPAEARAFYQAAINEHPSFYPKAFQNLQALNAEKAENEPTAPSIKPKK